jgi:hypothetical protein
MVTPGVIDASPILSNIDLVLDGFATTDIVSPQDSATQLHPPARGPAQVRHPTQGLS